MASVEPQYIEQLQLLQERYPHERKHKLSHLLRKHNGDVDQVDISFILISILSPLIPPMRGNGGYR